MNITEVVTYTIAPRNRRREELSFCNVLFCLLVLFIHISAEPVEGYARDSVLYFLAVGFWRLSSFVVQGYFFLSGIRLFLSGRQETAGAFYLGRCRRVVLPYAVVFCLFALYFHLSGTASFTPAELLVQFLNGKICGHFYYVILICQFYLLMPLWQRIIRKTNIFLGLLTSLMIMLMSKVYMPELIGFLTGQDFADNGLLFTSYLFYFIAGTYCGLYYDRFRIFLDRYRRSLLFTWLGLGAVNWIFFWLRSRGVYWASWLELFHVLYCMYAVLACLSLGYLWREKKVFRTSLFRAADKWSYHVYLLHPLVIFMGNSLFRHLGLSSLSLRFLLRTVLVYGVMTGFVWLLGKLPSGKYPGSRLTSHRLGIGTKKK